MLLFMAVNAFMITVSNRNIINIARVDSYNELLSKNPSRYPLKTGLT